MRKISEIILMVAIIIFAMSCGNTQNSENDKNDTSKISKKDTIKTVDEQKVTENKIIEFALDDYLLLQETEESVKYVDKNGTTVIPDNKYVNCFTDTFRNYALVLDTAKGFIAINRKEQFLYNVFVFDNAPDEAKDGLFRIIKNNKIGYADAKSGKIIIEPIYQAAESFENGVAKVALIATKEQIGEHYIWKSDNWFNIDKTGSKVK